MTQRVGENLIDVNDNIMVGYWEEVRIRGGSFSTFSGRYDWEFSTGYDEILDLTKSYFVIDDSLTASAGTILTVGNIARVVNHCSALWNNGRIAINDVEICNESQICIADTIAQRLKTSELEKNYGFGELTGFIANVSNSGNNFPERNAQDVLYSRRETVWQPQCLGGIFEKEIPQNVDKFRISLVADASDYKTKVVETSGAAVLGTHYAYTLNDVRFYAYKTRTNKPPPMNSEFGICFRLSEF